MLGEPGTTYYSAQGLIAADVGDKIAEDPVPVLIARREMTGTPEGGADPSSDDDSSASAAVLVPTGSSPLSPPEAVREGVGCRLAVSVSFGLPLKKRTITAMAIPTRTTAASTSSERFRGGRPGSGSSSSSISWSGSISGRGVSPFKKNHRQIDLY